MPDADNILQHLQQRFGADAFQQQNTVDDMLTLWLSPGNIIPVIQHLKSAIEKPFSLLYDICGADERDRRRKQLLPAKDFTVIYHLFSFDRNSFIRLKVALADES